MKIGRIQGEIPTRVRAVFLKVRPPFFFFFTSAVFVRITDFKVEEIAFRMDITHRF